MAEPNAAVAAALADRFVWGEPADLLARCSVVTPAIIGEVARSNGCKSPGILMHRLLHRVAALQAKAERKKRRQKTQPLAPPDPLADPLAGLTPDQVEALAQRAFDSMPQWLADRQRRNADADARRGLAAAQYLRETKGGAAHV
ncbi:MAG: hypothetical protein AAGG38_15050 [Planctomycetota bacterium]